MAKKEIKFVSLSEKVGSFLIGEACLTFFSDQVGEYLQGL